MGLVGKTCCGGECLSCMQGVMSVPDTLIILHTFFIYVKTTYLFSGS